MRSRPSRVLAELTLKVRIQGLSATGPGGAESAEQLGPLAKGRQKTAASRSSRALVELLERYLDGRANSLSGHGVKRRSSSRRGIGRLAVGGAAAVRGRRRRPHQLAAPCQYRVAAGVSSRPAIDSDRARGAHFVHGLRHTFRHRTVQRRRQRSTTLMKLARPRVHGDLTALRHCGRHRRPATAAAQNKALRPTRARTLTVVAGRWVG